MSGETNKLVKLTKQISNRIIPSEYDSIVETGEQIWCRLQMAESTLPARARGMSTDDRDA